MKMITKFYELVFFSSFNCTRSDGNQSKSVNYKKKVYSWNMKKLATLVSLLRWGYIFDMIYNEIDF